MMRTATLLLSIVFAVFAGCKSKDQVVAETPPVPPAPDTVVAVTPEPPALPDTVIYYQRTMCFGACPAFTFVALDNGLCMYNGRNYVDLIGSYKGRYSAKALDDVYAAAEAVGYDTLKAKYDNPMVSDLPSVITEIKGQRVVNRYRGPDLQRLYTALDSLVESVDWKGDGNGNDR